MRGGVNRSGILRNFEACGLRYSLQWPLTMVVNARAMRLYNDIFDLLLQVRCARSSLQMLQFNLRRMLQRSTWRHFAAEKGFRRDGDGDVSSAAERRSVARTKAATQRQIEALAAELLHFVSTLNNYLMNRIVFGAWPQFERDLAACCEDSGPGRGERGEPSIEMLARLHMEYLEKVRRLRNLLFSVILSLL